MVNRKHLIIFIGAPLIILLDQLTKYLIDKFMQIGDSTPIINKVFHITFLTNTGAGFGILKGYPSLLIWFSIIVIGIIFYWYDKIPNNKAAIFGVSLILGGIIGNLIDRIRFGYVIDFLDFRIWPTFNIADSAITIGAILLIIDSFKKNEK